MKNDTDFDSPEDAIAAVEASGATFVIIVSDDQSYPGIVPSLAKALKENNRERVVMVAGAPGEHENDWREAGVDDFISVRTNNYQKNKELLIQAGALS
jgi:methylmalonyl-CoA mutase